MKKIIVLFIACLYCLLGFGQWVSLTSGTSNGLNNIFFIDENTGFVVGDNGTIRKTTNAGTNWSLKPSGTTENLYSVFFIDANIGWVAGLNETIKKTTNGGANWFDLIINHNKNNIITFNYNNICFGDENVGMISGNAGMEGCFSYYSTDGGENWTLNAHDCIGSIWFLNPSTGYMAGENGKIYKTTDGGMNWSFQTCGTSNYLRSIKFTDANIGCTIGNNGTILKTTNGGANWGLQNSGTTEDLFSVSCPNNNTYYIAGSSGKILKTINGGTNWTSQSSGTSVNLNSIFFTNSLTGYVVGSGGTILKTTNGGSWINEYDTPNTKISVYPNPNNGNFTFNLQTDVSENVVLRIDNLAKLCIYYETYFLTKGNNSHLIDLKNIPSGVYIITIKGIRTNCVKKLVIL